MQIVESFHQHFKSHKSLVDSLIDDKIFFNNLQLAANEITHTFKCGGKLITCGNGGSMADAVHFAEELSGKFRGVRSPLPAVSISDTSYITCVANDFGFEYIFSRYVEAFGKTGDCLTVFTTSGNSKNVINASKIANSMGLKVIAFTGNSGGEVANYANIEIRVPHFGYADLIQEIHIIAIHSLIEYIENELKEV